jgi:hypothetical protein
MLKIMDGHGHTEVKWDVEDPASVEKAREVFQHRILAGYHAYAVAPIDTAGQRKGAVIKEFDPTVERVVIAPPMAGG